MQGFGNAIISIRVMAPARVLMSGDDGEISYVPGEDGSIERKVLCDNYTWAQNRELLTVYIPIGEVKTKDVVYKLTPKTLCIGIKGSAPVLDCELFSTVKPDESLWEVEIIEGQRNVAAKLHKAKSQNWPSLLKAV
jgi:hypothetical protein